MLRFRIGAIAKCLVESLFDKHTIPLNYGEIVYSTKENGVPPLPQNVSLSFMDFLFSMKGYFLVVDDACLVNFTVP